jgi:MFS transporter, DHA2 family, multidrug resistance protein
VPDASGLFNLMRNLGGAIGLALIDTVIYSRSPVHGAAIMEKLQAGDVETARFIGIPLAMFTARPTGPLDAETAAMLQPFVEKAALVRAVNEAWMMIAALTIAALLCVPFARVSSSAANAPAAPTVNSRWRDIFRGSRRNSWKWPASPRSSPDP